MFQPQGGVEGGTHIKIEGNSFDGYHGATTVSWLSENLGLKHDLITGVRWRPAM